MALQTSLGRAAASSGYRVSIQVDTSQIGEAARTMAGLGARYGEVNHRLAPLLAQVGALAVLDSSGQGAGAQLALLKSVGQLALLVETTGAMARALEEAARAYEAAEAYASQLLADYGDFAVPTYGALSAFIVNPASLSIVVAKNGVRVSSTSKAARAVLDRFLESKVSAFLLPRVAGKLSRYAESFGLTGDLKAYTRVQETAPDYLDPARPFPHVLPAPPLAVPPRTPAEASAYIERAHEYTHTAADAYTKEHLGLEGEWDGIMINTYLDQETGETVYLVVVPGSGGDPLDLGAYDDGGVLGWANNPAAASSLYDPHRAVQDNPAAFQLVLQAMREMGIPEGATVGFMGFSQGGMIAASLADHSEVNSRYKVKALITQNTPVHGRTPTRGVPHLDITHRQDPVHRLQHDNPYHDPTEQTMVGHGAWLDMDQHKAQAMREATAASPEAQQESEVLTSFFDGDYQMVDSQIYAGTTRDPELSGAGLRAQQMVGAANGTNAVLQDVGVDLPLLGYVPSGSLNPNDAFFEIGQGIEYIEETLLGPYQPDSADQPPLLAQDPYEIYEPIPWDPPQDGRKPPIPMPDDGMVYYSQEPHLAGAGGNF